MSRARRPPARRRLALGASAVLLGQVSAVAGGILTSVFVARTFGPTGTGTYALMGNVFGALVLLVSFGLPTGITFMVSRRLWPAGAAFRQSHGAALVMGLVGSALGLGFYALTNDSILDGVSVAGAVAVSAAVPCGLAWAFSGAVAIACDLYAKYAGFQLSRSLLTFGCVVALGGEFGLTGAIVGFAVAQALSAALAAVSLLRFTRRSREEETDDPVGQGPGALRQGLKFGGKTWGADLLQFLNYRVDLFILAAFATRADVGRYSLAVSLTMLAWLVPTAVGQALLPRTASLDSAIEKGEVSREEADRAVARVIRHTVVMQLPTGLALAVLLLVGIPLVFGSAFHHSIALGFLLLPGVLMLSVGKVASTVVTGRGFPLYALYIALITVPVTLLLYGLLIPPLAAVGAAVASSVSYALSTVLAMHFYRRATGSSAWAAVIPTRADLREYPGAVSQLVSASRSRLSALRRGHTPRL